MSSQLLRAVLKYSMNRPFFINRTINANINGNVVTYTIKIHMIMIEKFKCQRAKTIQNIPANNSAPEINPVPTLSTSRYDQANQG